MNLPTPHREIYLNAKPFPYHIIDGAFDIEDLMEVLYWWPKSHEGHDTKYNKSHTRTEEKMHPLLSNFIKITFQSQKFIGFLEYLTGITGLVLDCYDPSLHETFPGGSLAPHLDYTINKRTGLQHRVNAILYLNEGWENQYGGNLELYESSKMHGGYLTRPVVCIEPIFNRLAIFNIDERAWHGHPSVVNCPYGMSRKSIAVNYFSLPENNAADIGTTFKKSILKRVVHYIKRPSK